METPIHLPTERPVADVDLYLASGGNHFMTEIARMFQEGFQALGLRASLHFDEVPPADNGGRGLRVLVAQHEFLSLFLQRRLARRELNSVLAGCYLLNTEQPGSAWFEQVLKAARKSRGVFDINRRGVREFQRWAMPAAYTPLGYAPSLEDLDASDRDTPDADAKDVDIVFLGHHSPKREWFLANHAHRLQKLDCHLILADVRQPRLAASPNYLAGATRNRLLRRSRLLINVHSADRKYFEWHRVLCGMAHHCVVISEDSQDTDPLVNGKHLVLADLSDLVGCCEHYLRNEAERREMAQRAYQFLRSELPIERSCRTMLQVQGTLADQTGSLADESVPTRIASRVQGIGHVLLRQVHSTGRQVQRLPRHCKRVLCHNLLVHDLRRVAWSLYARMRGRWSLREIERRRRTIIRRLDARENGCSTSGPEARYDIVANSSYSSLENASVSVIITVHNYARFVAPCLESVAHSRCEQIPGGIEAIVVDDASTDSSPEVAERALRQLALPGRLVRKSENTGLADSRNLGVQLSRSPLVFILDVDNLIYPHCLSKLYQTIGSSKAAGAYAAIKRFDDRTKAARGLLSHYAWEVRRLLAAPYIDAMAMLDREKLLAVGGYSTGLIRYGWLGWEDYDLWLKLAEAGYSCEYRPEILSSYRVHGDSMINVTGHYHPMLLAHFREKFADLVNSNPPGKTLFGLPVAPSHVAPPHVMASRTRAQAVRDL